MNSQIPKQNLGMKFICKTRLGSRHTHTHVHIDDHIIKTLVYFLTFKAKIKLTCIWFNSFFSKWKVFLPTLSLITAKHTSNTHTQPVIQSVVLIY